MSDQAFDDIAQKVVCNIYPSRAGELQYLNEGSYAKVYRFGDKVMKISEDPYDAEISRRALGKDLKVLVNTESVFKINVKNIKLTAYAIINEYIESDNRGYVEEFKELSHFIESKQHSISYEYENSTRDLLMGFDKPIKDKIENDIITCHKKFLRDLNKSVKLPQDLSDQILQMYKEASSLEMLKLDIHPANILIENGSKIRFIDLGHYETGTNDRYKIPEIQAEFYDPAPKPLRF